MSRQGEHSLLDAAQLGHIGGNHLRPEAVALGIAQVHPQQGRAEQAGLVPAGTAADFHHHVLVIVRVAGEQKELQLPFHVLLLQGKCLCLSLGHLAKVGVIQHAAGFLQLTQAGLVAVPCLHLGLQDGALLQQLLILGLIGNDFRLADGGGQLVEAALYP